MGFFSNKQTTSLKTWFFQGWDWTEKHSEIVIREKSWPDICGDDRLKSEWKRRLLVQFLATYPEADAVAARAKVSKWIDNRNQSWKDGKFTPDKLTAPRPKPRNNDSKKPTRAKSLRDIVKVHDPDLQEMRRTNRALVKAGKMASREEKRLWEAAVTKKTEDAAIKAKYQPMVEQSKHEHDEKREQAKAEEHKIRSAMAEGTVSSLDSMSKSGRAGNLRELSTEYEDAARNFCMKALSLTVVMTGSVDENGNLFTKSFAYDPEGKSAPTLNADTKTIMKPTFERHLRATFPKVAVPGYDSDAVARYAKYNRHAPFLLKDMIRMPDSDVADTESTNEDPESHRVVAPIGRRRKIAFVESSDEEGGSEDDRGEDEDMEDTEGSGDHSDDDADDDPEDDGLDLFERLHGPSVEGAKQDASEVEDDDDDFGLKLFDVLIAAEDDEDYREEEDDLASFIFRTSLDVETTTPARHSQSPKPPMPVNTENSSQVSRPSVDPSEPSPPVSATHDTEHNTGEKVVQPVVQRRSTRATRTSIPEDPVENEDGPSTISRKQTTRAPGRGPTRKAPPTSKFWTYEPKVPKIAPKEVVVETTETVGAKRRTRSSALRPEDEQEPAAKRTRTRT